MIPVLNHHVEGIEYQEFKLMYVSQVIAARESIFREMCQELNITKSHYIQACFLNKRSVTKEKLIGWLETECSILDSFSVPLLKNAVRRIDDANERIDELQKEKIVDQQTIIKLREQVIKKHSDGLKDVKSTVQTEMKSYSSIVQKTCSSALSTRKIAAAVKNVTDKDDRSKNVIIYGIEETSGEMLQNRVEQVLEVIDEKPVLRELVGSPSSGRIFYGPAED
jgi:superfamily I DNA and RNA helicase